MLLLQLQQNFVSCIDFYLLTQDLHMFIYIVNLWENIMITANVNYTVRQTFYNHNSHTQF